VQLPTVEDDPALARSAPDARESTAATASATASGALMTAIVPAYNEAETIGAVISGLLALDLPLRVLVVDDGSRDGTAAVALAAGAEVLHHIARRGNGAAIKSGLASLGQGLAADRQLVALLDGDGQHDPAQLPALWALLHDGADLAVAARTSFAGSGWARDAGNRLLCALAAFMTRQPVPDLTSGFRVFRLGDMRPWIPLLPQGFSTPTTSTLAFLHSGRRVAFLDVPARPRAGGGRTRTRLLRDGPWFCAIAIKITTLFDPGRALTPLTLGLGSGLAVGLALGATLAGGALLLGLGLVLGPTLALARGCTIQRSGLRRPAKTAPHPAALGSGP